WLECSLKSEENKSNLRHEICDAKEVVEPH
ncbi:MAG: hypothetical protein UW93_C0026G0001, partial [Parcubacteria group bacterium GW2011_GWC1_45_13]